jgi:bifunctional NMN adenylyltransferase/nudix hydrolase
MNTFKYTASIFIGRCQPPHIPHIEHIMRGLEYSEHVVVLPGSTQETRTMKNPLNFFERADIIKSNIPEALRYRVLFRPLRDFKDNDKWVHEVKMQTLLALETVGVPYNDAKIALLGTHKDESSWYLREFPFYDHIGHAEPLHHNGQLISATDIRNVLFQNEDHLDELRDIISDITIQKLRDFRKTDGWHIIMSKK